MFLAVQSQLKQVPDLDLLKKAGQGSIMYLSFLLLISLLVIDKSSSYPHFNGLNQHPHPQIEKFLDPDAADWRTLKMGDVPPCNVAAILNFVETEDLQRIIEGMASKNGVSPYMILKKLHRRMKNKEEIEENMINAIDGSPPPDLFSHSDIDVPPVIKLPPETNRAPYYLPSNSIIDDTIEDTQVVFVPVTPSKLPIGKTPEHNKHRSINNIGPLTGKMSNMLPGVFHSPRSNHPKPLIGATVRVNPGDSVSSMSRDIIVTVSPLMTLIEALRQAENKYQNVLGLDHNTDVINFAHSEEFDCYIVNSIYDVVQNDDSGWKVTITDRDGQMVYDSFCLPNGKDNIVKPGTVISLTYVPLNV